MPPSRLPRGWPTRTSLAPWKMLLTDDAFTLLRRATALLPEGARAENGVTVDDVRDGALNGTRSGSSFSTF